MRTALCAALLLLAVAAPADAGPVESPGELAFGPAGSGLRAVRYDYGGGGLMLSDDGGDTYRLMCNRVIDAGVTRETAGLVIGPGGRLFTGTFGGMWMGTADGCGWTAVDIFDGRWVSGIAAHPDNPAALFAITGNAGAEYDNGIHLYDGLTDRWTPWGSFESALLLDLHVTRTPGGLRFWQALARGQDAEGRSRYFIRYSDDDAATWTEHAFPPTDGNVRLRAVDPQNADRIAVSIDHGDNLELVDEVWLSDAAGEAGSYRTVGTPQTFGGAVFTQDGALWWSDAEGPLSVLRVGAVDAMDAVVVNAQLGARCLARNPADDALHACRIWQVGRVDQATGDFTVEVDFSTASEWLQCDGVDVPALCEVESGEAGWCGPSHYPDAPLCAAYGYDWYTPATTADVPDAAVNGGDGSDGGDGGPATLPSGDDGGTASQDEGGDGGDGGGCGCRAVGGDASSSAGPLGVALAGLLLLHRRRARR